jgi:hypothetical protein
VGHVILIVSHVAHRRFTERTVQIMTTLAEHIMIYKLCESCMQAAYDSRAPNAAYIQRGAMLLFGTAAHESGGFRYDRQIGFEGAHTMAGAWSWWQLESASVSDSVARLRRYPVLAERCANWLFQRHDANHRWFETMNMLSLLCLLREWPRLACLFARLHYLRVPEPIPEGLGNIAAYYKSWYNTSKGKATPAQFVAAWCEYGEPVLSAFRGETT